MITQFHVENFKALKNVTLDLTPIHVLIGPNDSGKTSILQAMAALSRSMSKPINEIFLGRWKNTPLLWGASSFGSMLFNIKLLDHNSESEYEMKLSISDNNVKLYSEKLFYNGKIHESTNIKDRDHTLIAYPISHLLEASLYRWHAQNLSLPVAIDKNRNLRMETNGFGLAQFLDDILGMDRERFVQLESRFRSIFPQIESVLLKSESAFKGPVDQIDLTQRLTESDGKGIWIKFAGLRVPISASQVSEGMLIVLGYLSLLYSPSPPRILLIEEPENGIHPQRLRDILRILRDLILEQTFTQIVMTTHSPDVVAEFSPEEVTLCAKNEEGAVVTRRLSDIPDVKKYNDFFTLGEIWTMKGDEKLMESHEENVPGVAP